MNIVGLLISLHELLPYQFVCKSVPNNLAKNPQKETKKKKSKAIMNTEVLTKI